MTRRVRLTKVARTILPYLGFRVEIMRLFNRLAIEVRIYPPFWRWHKKVIQYTLSDKDLL